MSALRKIVNRLLLAALLGVVLVCMFVSFHDDFQESYYPSLAEADEDGAITRGWIPDDLLPRSSRAIREAHDLSPSTEWCAFEFAPADSQNLRNNLKNIDALPPSVRHVPNPYVAWWPNVLKGNLDTQRIHREGFELYAVERPATSVTTEILLFAINWSKGRGFFYSTSNPAG